MPTAAPAPIAVRTRDADLANLDPVNADLASLELANTDLASVDVASADTATRAAMRHQAWAVFAIVVGVGCVDQIAKAWAWRHLSTAYFDSGGGLLLTPGVGAWFRDRVVGAMFDLVNSVLLVAAWLMLIRRRRPTAVLVSGALVLAGWTTNLADRLGLHHWTGPHSVRGVEDFLPLAGRSWNLADLAIIAGSGALLVSLLMATNAPPRLRSIVIRRTYARRWTRIALLVGLAVAVALAAASAVDYGVVTTPFDYFAPSP